MPTPRRLKKLIYSQYQHLAFHHWWLFSTDPDTQIRNFNTWKRWVEATDRLLDITTSDILIKEIKFQDNKGESTHDTERVPD